MPFTSTANIGLQLAKPSIYYDSTGLLQKNDQAAHGVKIVQGKDELRRWLREL